MGSELVESETGTKLWGLAAGLYARFWTSSSPWEKLKVTEAERNGQVGRVKPVRLLRAPAFAPLLRGFEPYSGLTAGIRQIVPDPAAILEFAYDWRLPVAFNAGRLAAAAREHLTQWRGHALGRPDAKLVLVAHSMGGLVAQHFTQLLGDAGDVRLTITIGTPFQGAVKAVLMLSDGDAGALPLPRHRLRELARTLPGVYDLLPSYRCVAGTDGTRRLSAADVARLGGARDLAELSAGWHERLAAASAGPPASLRTVVGVEQATMQSVRLRDGAAEPLFCMYEEDGPVDRGGDGTVYSQAATGGVEPSSSLPQSHGALAQTPEALAVVRALLTRGALGPPLGGPARGGLDVPEFVLAGQQFEVSLTGPKTIINARYRVVDCDTGRPVAQGYLQRRPGALAAPVRLPRPGLYRVEVSQGAPSATSQLVMAVAGRGDVGTPT